MTTCRIAVDLTISVDRWVLEAAHVTPYLGPETNDITNGLLLRADLHTLLDCRQPIEILVFPDFSLAY